MSPTTTEKAVKVADLAEFLQTIEDADAVQALAADDERTSAAKFYLARLLELEAVEDAEPKAAPKPDVAEGQFITKSEASVQLRAFRSIDARGVGRMNRYFTVDRKTLEELLATSKGGDLRIFFGLRHKKPSPVLAMVGTNGVVNWGEAIVGNLPPNLDIFDPEDKNLLY